MLDTACTNRSLRPQLWNEFSYLPSTETFPLDERVSLKIQQYKWLNARKIKIIRCSIDETSFNGHQCRLAFDLDFTAILYLTMIGEEGNLKKEFVGIVNKCKSLKVLDCNNLDLLSDMKPKFWRV